MLSKNRVITILLLIIIFAFTLRIIGISKHSLYGDELTMVYDSYSLLKTGKDQLGETFPLTFRMGAGRPAGYVYFSIPFVAMFGPSALGVRALSVLSSMGIIVLVYFLGKRLFNDKVGLLAAFFTAISPWSLSLSRGGFEAHFALFLSLLGVVSFMYAKKRPWLYLLFVISWGLAIHTYPTYKLVLPLFFVVLYWFVRFGKILSDKKYRKALIISAVVAVIFVSLSLVQTTSGLSEERFSKINVFANDNLREDIVQKINYERDLSNLPPGFARLLHNKGIEYSKLLLESYIKNFSTEYLLISGDGNPRHNMAQSGVILWIEAILIFYAIVKLWKNEKRKLTFLILWLLISPVAGLLLLEPHSLRNSFMMIPLVVLSGYGIYSLTEMKDKKLRSLLLGIVILAIVIQLVLILENIYFVSPKKHAKFWAYSAKQAAELALEEKANFDYVIISDRIDAIEFAYPVYANTDPTVVQLQNKQRDTLGNYNFKKIDNVYIGNIPQDNIDNFINSLDAKILFIGDYINDYNSVENIEILNSQDFTGSIIVKKVNIEK